MRDVKKVAVIGHFGGEKVFLDGQTVKTKNFVAALKANTNWNVECIDTFYKKRNPLKLFKNIKKVCSEYKDIFVMPSSRGLSLIMIFLKKYIKKKGLRVHHIVIGGMFPSYLHDAGLGQAQQELVDHMRGDIRGDVHAGAVFPLDD